MRYNRIWRNSSGVLEIQVGGHWQTTGDRIEIDEPLIRVVGRADAIANVAGTKVDLAQISGLAEQVWGVRRAVALVEPSPIIGQIVCLKYALDPDCDKAAVTEAMQIHLRTHLRKEAWPRRWQQEEVGLASNAKRTLR
jgi:acyl-coenzyme A synthetase/AMP-(fatty) acid ligase